MNAKSAHIRSQISMRDRHASVHPASCSRSRTRIIRRIGCISMLLAASTWVLSIAHAVDGDSDPHFGNVLPGRSRVQFGATASRQVANAVAIQADGKLILAGDVNLADGPAIGVTRLTANGQLDTSFADGGTRSISFPNTYLYLDGHGIALQADGKIVLVGTWYPTSANPDFLILRLNADGSNDTSFNSSGMQTVAFDLGGINSDFANAVALQPDGKIVVAGEAFRPGSGPNPPARMSFVRLNADGSLDQSFGFGGKSVIDAFDNGSLGAATTIATNVFVQRDGKILATGTSFWQASNIAYFAAARLNADGSLDTTFDPSYGVVTFNFGTSTYQWEHGAALQRDGKVILVGTVNGDYAIARLNPDGSFDTAFGAGGVLTAAFDYGGNLGDTASDVVVQSDDRIIVAGYSDTGPYPGTNAGDFSALRLLPNGALDGSFGSGGKTRLGFDLGGSGYDFANALLLQDGKPVLVGAAEVDPPPNYNGPTTFVFAAARLDNDLIFTGRFDP